MSAEESGARGGARGERHTPPADEEARRFGRCKAGDSAGSADLVLLHLDAIYNALYRLLGNEEDARDAAQETFLKAYRSLRRFRGDSRFGTWLYRIAINTALSVRRRRKSAPRLISLSSAGGEDRGFDPPSATVEASETASMSEEAEMAQEALMALNEEQRHIIVLHDINGHSYAEIAEILGCASGTVKSRLHTARVSQRQVVMGRLKGAENSDEWQVASDK